MKKQELFKQADYTFQRGNRGLAKKLLTEFLTAHPRDEAGWMLMARIEEDKERRIECCERAIQINPNNHEARLALLRLKSASPTLPKPDGINTSIWRASRSYKSTLRAVLAVVIAVFLFGTTTLVVARNNPKSNLAKMLALSTPVLYDEPSIGDDIAPQTRAQIGVTYPQYSPLVDTLIGFAVENAKDGMAGAPERPGAEIIVSDKIALDTVKILENAIPQPGSLSSATITEQQITSWFAMEMKDSPDLPLSDVQVYLRDGRIQVWGIVSGNESSTSALIVGTLKIDSSNQPHFEIESLQIGRQIIPKILVSQVQSWLNQVIADQINSQVPGLELMNISVTKGLITVSGMR
ncbi:MAG: hypothetical protein QY332_01255 [Anaerolineales bacterium]|nr:MAG: hypothetical protein QY332_01255 [Anaerolineales bacterium]